MTFYLVMNIIKLWYVLFYLWYMDTYIPDELLDNINQLIEAWRYEDAIDEANKILIRDPKNEQALLIVTDILYRQWDMEWADRAVTFLNSMKKDEPLWLYIKWLLEMEKNNWKEARSYLRKAMQLTNSENYEIIRCYGLSEYWYGNREKWRNYLRKAFKQNSLDAEVVYNIIQLAILDEDYEESSEMVEFFYKNHEDLKVVDKPLVWYDKKVALFEKFIKSKILDFKKR